MIKSLMKRWRAYQRRQQVREVERALGVLLVALDDLPPDTLGAAMMRIEAMPVIVCAGAIVALEKAARG